MVALLAMRHHPRPQGRLIRPKAMTEHEDPSSDRLKQHFAQRVINQARQLLEVWQRLQRSDAQLNLSGEKLPYVFLVVGVNGVGKTTTIGKLAGWLTEGGWRVVLGAADTFRAAAAEQLHDIIDQSGQPPHHSA